MEEKKPPLTEENVNQLSEALLTGGGPEEKKNKLKKDWRAFVRSEFRLSKAQRDDLPNNPQQEAEKIQGALNDAVDHGGELQLKLGSEAGGSGRLAISKDSSGETSDEAAADARALKIPLIECTFDDNCENWECGLPDPL